MRRREFIAGLGSAAAWPVVARGQQPDRVRRISVVMASAYSRGIADRGACAGPRPLLPGAGTNGGV